jgi:hypothetical protein
VAINSGDGVRDVFTGESEGGVDVFAAVVEPRLELEIY